MTEKLLQVNGRIACLIVALLLLAPGSYAQAQLANSNAADGEIRSRLAAAEGLIADARAEQAYRLLGPMEAELAGDPYFDYLLGVAALDAGRISDAIFSLRRAVAVAPEYSSARLELGRAYYEVNNYGQARPLFIALLDDAPPPAVRDVLRSYIDSIDGKARTQAGQFRPYVNVRAGFDSNANGSTSDQQFLGFTLDPMNRETDSPYAEIGAGFTWVVPESSRLSWLVSGRLAQRDNSNASFVNRTIANGFAGASWQRGEFFGRAGVDAYWAARDGDSNENYTGADLLFGRRIATEWDATIGLRAGAQRFDSTIDVYDVDRFIVTLGLVNNFSATSRLDFQVLGGGDSEKITTSPYGNSKFGARVNVSTEIGAAAFLHASIGTLTTDYDGLFFGFNREDKQTTAVLQIEFRDVFANGIIISPELRYTHNDSDVALYDFDRTEIGLLFRWTP